MKEDCKKIKQRLCKHGHYWENKKEHIKIISCPTCRKELVCSSCSKDLCPICKERFVWSNTIRIEETLINDCKMLLESERGRIELEINCPAKYIDDSFGNKIKVEQETYKIPDEMSQH